MQKQLVLLGLLALTLIVKNLTLVWLILVIIIIKPFLSSHIVFYQLPTGEMSISNSIDIRVFSHVQLVESIIKFCCFDTNGECPPLSNVEYRISVMFCGAIFNNFCHVNSNIYH